jgi:RNA polymerase sigma factor (TIGR02999 family)
MNPSSQSVTQLLLDWRNGDQTALDRLMPLVYEELRRIAAHYMRNERQGRTLQTSALVNEAYLRLVDHENIEWQNRAHFFGVAAQAMRRILVDYARSRNYQKRGCGARQVSLDEAATVAEAPPAKMAAALLAEKESRAGQTIGHYEIIREIGRGGMGKVYLARHPPGPAGRAQAAAASLHRRGIAARAQI